MMFCSCRKYRLLNKFNFLLVLPNNQNFQQLVACKVPEVLCYQKLITQVTGCACKTILQSTYKNMPFLLQVGMFLYDFIYPSILSMLKLIMQHLCISRYRYFQRFFYRYVGCTPFHWLQMVNQKIGKVLLDSNTLHLFANSFEGKQLSKNQNSFFSRQEFVGDITSQHSMHYTVATAVNIYGQYRYISSQTFVKIGKSF